MVSEPLTFDKRTKNNISNKLFRQDKKAVEWRINDGLLPYPDAVEFMKQQVAARSEEHTSELQSH